MRSNTLLAHRLLWLAEQCGVQEAVQERLLRAYFCEGRNMGDPDALAELAADVGLDADEVRAYLDSDAGRPEVEEQLRRAVELGMTAVPTYSSTTRGSFPARRTRRSSYGCWNGWPSSRRPLRPEPAAQSTPSIGPL